MFSLFPEIMFLTPAAIALLRVVAGLYLIYIGYFFWNERAVVAQERFPIIGRMPEWLSILAATLQIGLGVLLVFGVWTQLVALLGAIIALKCFLFGKTYKKIIPLDAPASILLLIMCIALVVMGAGALAFDLPL